MIRTDLVGGYLIPPPVQVLQVKAVDGDRSINNDIEYSITGGPDNIFGINKDTGTVYSKVRHLDSVRTASP